MNADAAIALQQQGRRIDDVAAAMGVNRKRLLAVFRKQGYDPILYHLDTIHSLLQSGATYEDVLSQTGVDLHNNYQKTHLRRLLERRRLGHLPQDGKARRLYPSRAVVFDVVAAQDEWTPWQRLAAAMIADAVYTLDMEFLRGEWGFDCMSAVNIDQEGLLALMASGGGHYGQALGTEPPDSQRYTGRQIRTVEAL